jgi:hypothetical protein
MINKINTQTQERDDIVNNHKVGKEDIHGREHRTIITQVAKVPLARRMLKATLTIMMIVGNTPLRHYHV